MDAAAEQLQSLLELEARHQELLDRLAELDRRVAEVLAQYQATRPPGPSPHGCGDLCRKISVESTGKPVELTGPGELTGKVEPAGKAISAP